ncbi:MAG: hypothetical protein K0M78_00115, partial [Brevundimonas sp.]|nr:hypothetical protein [Brevundimonas sp.]
PERYFNLGIVEQHAVSLAAGMARRGLVPLLHSFSNFLARRAHDQIAVSVAWPQCNVKLIGGSCGLFDGRNGPSHQAIDDLGAMAALPGVVVMEPGDQRQTCELLGHAARIHGPVYLRLRRFGAPADLTSGADPLKPTTLEAPRDAVATLVACGSMLELALQAARLLADAGRPIELLHVAVLRPLDPTLLVESALRTGAIAVVENHGTSGGFGSIIGEAIEPLGVRLLRIGLPHSFLPAGSPSWQADQADLSAEAIAYRVATFAEGREP